MGRELARAALCAGVLAVIVPVGLAIQPHLGATAWVYMGVIGVVGYGDLERLVGLTPHTTTEDEEGGR